MEIFDKDKRLFIISNRTHYLNIQTYIRTHPPGENYLIFINKYSKGYQDFILKLKNDKALKLVEVISHDQKQKFPYNKFQQISFFIKVHSLKKKFGTRYNTIFLTNYLSWKQHIILNQFGHNKVILINDGTVIFKTIGIRKHSRKIQFSHVNFLINKYLSLKTIKNLHFYSPLDLEVAEYDTLEIFNFKATNNSVVDPKKIYFVGSDLVELRFLPLEHHLRFLSQIKSKFPDCQITYFAHRAEKDDLLEKYKFFGKVIRDAVPFEERIEKEKELPSAIISYCSSVLINLPQVYPHLNFHYFPINMESIPKSSRFYKAYPELLEYFEKIKNKNFTRLEPEYDTAL